MHLRQTGFTYSACRPFTKNKEYKFLKKTRFKIYLSKRTMEILKIYLEEQHLPKYYVIKLLILLKSQNMMDVSEILLQWFTNFLIKSLLLHVPITQKLPQEKELILERNK